MVASSPLVSIYGHCNQKRPMHDRITKAPSLSLIAVHFGATAAATTTATATLNTSILPYNAYVIVWLLCCCYCCCRRHCKTKHKQSVTT